jgi:hypothetical protein
MIVAPGRRFPLLTPLLHSPVYKTRDRSPACPFPPPVTPCTFLPSCARRRLEDPAAAPSQVLGAPSMSVETFPGLSSSSPVARTAHGDLAPRSRRLSPRQSIELRPIPEAAAAASISATTASPSPSCATEASQQGENPTPSLASLRPEP